MSQILALLLACGFVAAAWGEVDVKFNGDVMYRWEFDYRKNYDDSGKVASTDGDFQNRYWWNLRLGINVNENLGFKIRLSNPNGYFTDNLGSNLAWAARNDVLSLVSIPEFYFDWNIKQILRLKGGILSVAGPGTFHTVMDLVAFEDGGGMLPGGYYGAGLMPWFVATNGSQLGMNLIVNHKVDDFSIGLDVVGTLAEDADPSLSKDAIKLDQFRYIFAVPISFMGKMLSVMPAMHLRTNLYRSDSLDEGNHSIVGGLDVWSTPIDMLTARAGFAIGGYSNSSVWDSTDASIDSIAPLGMLLNFGVRVKPGYGRALVDFAWGRWTDREADSLGERNMLKNGSLLYWDVLYDMPVKSLVIRPRVRIWRWGTPETDEAKLQVRPELDFIAKF
ncbi:MAG: hypothetical protein GF331_16370 [Chitinivibrionales bacterium]|nr:hypothetical protein [Chitinivibrionales bacterium]